MATTSPSRVLAAPRARPDRAARAASTASGVRLPLAALHALGRAVERAAAVGVHLVGAYG
ncbi:MAG: hypothetical protein ACRD03_11585 [Acidimicrobiales bacterium]